MSLRVPDPGPGNIGFASVAAISAGRRELWSEKFVPVLVIASFFLVRRAGFGTQANQLLYDCETLLPPRIWSR